MLFQETHCFTFTPVQTYTLRASLYMFFYMWLTHHVGLPEIKPATSKLQAFVHIQVLNYCSSWREKAGHREYHSARENCCTSPLNYMLFVHEWPQTLHIEICTLQHYFLSIFRHLWQKSRQKKTLSHIQRSSMFLEMVFLVLVLLTIYFSCTAAPSCSRQICVCGDFFL